jgi:hypothetical protein
MKPVGLMLLLGVASVPSVALASCPTASISMFAPPDPLPPLPRLVIHHQGDLMSEDVATQVVLVSGGRRVGVRAVQSLLGRLIRQFVVVPQTALSDGEWTVMPREGTAAFRAINGYPVGRFTVAHDASTAPPRFLDMPVSRGFSETGSDCGSDSVVRIEGAWLDRPGLVDVTIRGDDFELSGVTSAGGGLIELGVFMCGGAFDLPRGKTFAIVLRPLGTDGVQGDWRMVLASTPPLPPYDWSSRRGVFDFLSRDPAVRPASSKKPRR